MGNLEDGVAGFGAMKNGKKWEKMGKNGKKRKIIAKIENRTAYGGYQ
jgi:hypothetical protein